MAKTKQSTTSLPLADRLQSALVPEEKQPYEIPKNWAWVKLQSVCSIPITDGTHQTPTYTTREEGVPFISSKDVTTERINWQNIKYITQDLHEQLYKRIAPQVDDVLLAKNGTTGVAALVEDDFIFDIYVTLAVLRPAQNQIQPRYLYRFINSPVAKEQFNAHLTGIGLPNLHLKDIKVTMLPLPPLAEQERIVARLESLLGKLDEVKERVQNAVESFELQKASVLHKAFTGELTQKWRNSFLSERDSVYLLTSPFSRIPEEKHPYEIPKNWAWVTLGNLAKIKRGASPRPIKTYITTDENGVNWIKIGDTDSRKYITLTKEKITSEGAKKSVFVTKGTLLLSNSMSFGRPYILEIDGCIHDGWLALAPSSFLNKEFLYYGLLASNWYFEQVAVGTAVRNLNSERVSRTPLPLPSLAEQKEIVRLLDQFFERENQAKMQVETVLEEIELLKKSILMKAFRGELGTSNPMDENAIELLKKVV
ncbi:MAG: restriction endonuclease subunit S [Planctomycetia bacterium]|nr:restriction endonuclease subunit S [Planctomycetia bacterium]